MIPYIKKFADVLIYCLLLGLAVYLINDDVIGRLLSSDSAHKGILVRIALYFKDADTWAIIFMTITFGLGMGTFLLLSLCVDGAMSSFSHKYAGLGFFRSWWADYVIKLPLVFALLLSIFVLGANVYVTVVGSASTAYADDLTEQVPVFVLGTSKILPSGKENVYYRERVATAIDLYRRNKVKYFILSGDGVGEAHRDVYNETTDMRNDLMASGVPEEKIKTDPYGFNTQNSILRLRGVFRLKNVIIVSQRFHSQRAIVLSRYYGIEARSIDAKGDPTWSMRKREMLQARPKLIMDVLFANMQPRVTVDGDFGYRKEFSVIESDLHVTIVIMMCILMFVAPMGLGIYRAQEGPARRRAAWRYSIVTFVLSAALISLVIHVYKNLDVKFIDEIVETTARSFGVKTDKMEQREITMPIEEQTIALNNSPTQENKPLVSVAQPAALVKISEDFNSTVSEVSAPDQSAPVETAEGEEEIFNTAEGSAEPILVKTAAAKRDYFTVKVHEGQEIINDGTIKVRLVDNTTIDGETFPKHYVFECVTVMYSGRVLLTATKLGTRNVSLKNYQGNQEGIQIVERFIGNHGEIVFAEGEEFILGY